MRKTIMLTGAAMLIALAGCNRGAANNSAGANSATPTTNTATAAPATPAAPTAAPATGGAAVDAAFLTANPWGMLDACASTVTFAADGTATNSSDSEVAQWTLSGDTLTVTPPNKAPEPATVRREGANLVMNVPGAGDMTMTPCPAA